MRVSASSRAGAVAGAIIGKIRNGEVVTLETIGPSALNQATKALIIANGFLAKGETLVMTAKFNVLNVNGFERTAIIMDIKILSGGDE
mgnify:CR=1 FL=1